MMVHRTLWLTYAIAVAIAGAHTERETRCALERNEWHYYFSGRPAMSLWLL